MKCEMIKDLLPLYIDGLTSEESNREIEKHLKSCKECKAYYQEMTGEVSEPFAITDDEVKDVELIKKMKKRKRRGIIVGAAAGVLILLILVVIVVPLTYSRAKYEDVRLTYGVSGSTAYFSMETKPGYEVHFTGGSENGETHLKVLSVRKITDTGSSKMGWEEELGTEEDLCRWTIEFKDKIIVIEDGQLVEEKNK